jgi:hypothetical protein
VLFAVIGDKMYVFGGGDARRALNDVHVLEFSTMTWSRPADTGVLPAPRAGHSTVTLGNFVAVFGGASPDGTTYNDLHLLDTAYSLYDDGGAASDSSVAVGPPAARPHLQSSLRTGAGVESAAASPLAAFAAVASRPPDMYSHVTQSDNEACLSQRVPISRVVSVRAVAPARPPSHSIESLRTAMGLGGPQLWPRSHVSGSIAAAGGVNAAGCSQAAAAAAAVVTSAGLPIVRTSEAALASAVAAGAGTASVSCSGPGSELTANPIRAQVGALRTLPSASCPTGVCIYRACSTRARVYVCVRVCVCVCVCVCVVNAAKICLFCGVSFVSF